MLDAICQLEDEAAQVGHEPAALHCVPVERFDLDLALRVGRPHVVVASVEVAVQQAKSLLCLGDVRRRKRFLSTTVDRIPTVKLACDVGVVFIKFLTSLMERCEPATLCHDRLLIVEALLNVEFSARRELSHAELNLVGRVNTLPNIGARGHVFADVVDERHQALLFLIQKAHHFLVRLPRLDNDLLIVLRQLGPVDDVVVALNALELAN